MPAPRIIRITSAPAPTSPVAVEAYRATPLTLRLVLDRTRPSVAGWTTITVEIRRDQLDTAIPLAVATLANPTGSGPFDLDFTGAQMNQDLAGKGVVNLWIVIYASKDAGQTLDPWYAGRLLLRESGISQVAAAPPNVVGPLSRVAADALYLSATDGSQIPLSRIPLADPSALRPVIRVNDPDAYQIRYTHAPVLSIRASNQPDGSAPIMTAEAVHPSVLHFPARWRGWQWWMCITPYPGSDASYENPSILVSHDGLAWFEPAGGQNPIAPYPAGSASQGDVFLAYDPEGDRLIVSYARTTAASGNDIRMVYSSNGTSWTAPLVVLTHPTLVLGSPALVRYLTSTGAIRWRLYYNKADASGYFGPHFVESSDPLGVGNPWSASAVTLCVINGLGPGRVAWDFQMYNLPGGQWLYVPTVTYGGGGAATRPVLGTSDDGVTFECGKPLVRPTKSGEIGFDSLIYTTSLVPGSAGGVAFRAFTTGVVIGTGWRLKIGDVVLRPKGLPVGSQKVFEFNYRYNLAPASGPLTTVGALTPEGVTAASTNGGAVKMARGAEGVTVDALGQYLIWAAPQPWTAVPEWTGICRFKVLGNPATASGRQTIFLVRNLLVEIRVLGGVWQLFVQQLAGTSAFVPQLLIPYTGFITIAVSWDGTVARFGSSLPHDYGGVQEQPLTAISASGDIWIGGGSSSGAPGGLIIDKFLLFDRATKENLEGLATSFDY